MPLERPELGYTWLQVPLDRALQVVILGDVYAWDSHWYRPQGYKGPQAVRCRRREAGECRFCELKFEIRKRYVFPVRVDDEAREVRVVELGRVQYPVMEVVYEMHGWVGCKLVLARERPARNAPIHVRHVREYKEIVPREAQVDVEGFAREQGLPMLRYIELNDLWPVPENPWERKDVRRG